MDTQKKSYKIWAILFGIACATLVYFSLNPQEIKSIINLDTILSKFDVFKSKLPPKEPLISQEKQQKEISDTPVKTTQDNQQKSEKTLIDTTDITDIEETEDITDTIDDTAIIGQTKETETENQNEAVDKTINAEDSEKALDEFLQETPDNTTGNITEALNDDGVLLPQEKKEIDEKNMVDNHINQSKKTLDDLNKSQELPEDDFFSVIDPKDNKEITKKSNDLFLDSEPMDNGLETSTTPSVIDNNALTKSLKKLPNDADADIDDIILEDNLDDIVTQKKDTPKNSDIPFLTDITKEDNQEKNNNNPEEILSIIEDSLVNNDKKDISLTEDMINNKIGNQLSLPDELFTISKQNNAQKQTTGIKPDKNYFDTSRTNTPQDTVMLPTDQPNSDKEPENNMPENNMIDLEDQNFSCQFDHFINTVDRTEMFTLVLTPEQSGQKPIRMQIKKNLELYQYLNMSLENIDNYPSEFSVLRHFCKTMTVKKSVSEDF